MNWWPESGDVNVPDEEYLQHVPTDAEWAEIFPEVAQPKPNYYKHLDRVHVPNRANSIHNYMLQYWPKLVNRPGVWVVGSTAYLLANGRAPDDAGDLDIICTDKAGVESVARLLGTTDQTTTTYMGGTRVYSNGVQVDIWALNPGQTIEDAINGFTNSHPQARVAYELATGKLIIYPNTEAM